MSFYQVSLISKLLVFILVIPFTFRSVASIDPEKIFIKRTEPYKKQWFYIIVTICLSFLLAEAVGLILSFSGEVILGV